MITQQDIRQFKEHGSWRELVALAAEMVADAERRAGGASMNPLMGGGTRLMLALDHRISDAVELFIHDAQWIGFLTPRLNEAFEDRLSGYEEDATWVKLKHQYGEIDFLVSGSLLNRKSECDPTLPFAFEPVEEVIAKKTLLPGLGTDRARSVRLDDGERAPELSTRSEHARHGVGGRSTCVALRVRREIERSASSRNAMAGDSRGRPPGAARGY